MQATARVIRAPAAWGALAAIRELAARPASAFAGRVTADLARIQVEPVPAEPRRRQLRIRIDYLRN